MEVRLEISIQDASTLLKLLHDLSTTNHNFFQDEELFYFKGNLNKQSLDKLQNFLETEKIAYTLIIEGDGLEIPTYIVKYRPSEGKIEYPAVPYHDKFKYGYIGLLELKEILENEANPLQTLAKIIEKNLKEEFLLLSSKRESIAS